MAAIDDLYAIIQNVKNMVVDAKVLRQSGAHHDLVTAKLDEAKAACEAAIAP